MVLLWGVYEIWNRIDEKRGTLIIYGETPKESSMLRDMHARVGNYADTMNYHLRPMGGDDDEFCFDITNSRNELIL